MTATDTTADALLANIKANPDDDAPRLQFADYLDDCGQGERAELIRVQCELARVQPDYKHTLAVRSDIYRGREVVCECRVCALRDRESELLEAHWIDWKPSVAHHEGKEFCSNLYRGDITGSNIHKPLWTFKRGFIEHISAPLAVLIGGDCQRCGGTGRHGTYPNVACLRCEKGRVGGILPAVLASPVAVITRGEQVGCSDKRPSAENEYGYHEWFNEGNTAVNVDHDSLPEPIWKALKGHADIDDECRWWKSYPTPDAATAALGRALLSVCR